MKSPATEVAGSTRDAQDVQGRPDGQAHGGQGDGEQVQRGSLVRQWRPRVTPSRFGDQLIVY